ncbi:hypothetical protein QJQ45_007913 [Haematococcus lacustris]|nr:hypothetical protein QJQ45_007913 [Haematococcus lacustris]
MGAWGAKPQVPCDTRWASYISSTVTMLRVWAHARDAVSQLLERQKGMSPPWAVTLSQLLQDNSPLLRLSVVAVVGESFLVPELMWASKDDGLHAFELYRHTQDVLARLETWDTLPLLAGLHSQLQHLLLSAAQTQLCASYGCRRLRMGSSNSNSSSCNSKRTLMALGVMESLLQLLKHGGGRYMELPALLQLMSLRTCKEAMKTVDVHDLQQRMGQLRAEVRRKEDAAAAAQRSAKAERQITDATHKVGRVVINVGDHACQQRLAAAHALALGGHDYGHTTVEEAMKMTGKQLQSYLQFHKQEVHTSWRVPKLLSHVCTHIRGKLAAAAPPQQQLTPAGTTPELAEPAGAPPQQQQQLAAASTSRKRGAPAANKSRAAKQAYDEALIVTDISDVHISDVDVSASAPQLSHDPQLQVTDFRHQLAHASTPAAPSTLPISEAFEDQAVAAQSPAADPAAAGAATSPNTASSSGAATPPGQLFEDEEYTYTAPATFTFVDIPIPKIERGPAPERSPLRSRFEAGDGGQASLAVVVRNAQTLSFSLLQVGDLSVWGTPEEAAKLLLPRGSVLLNSSQQQVEVPPRTTPLGPVALPPKSYYRYEFISAGQHVAVSAAATRGKVYVCGGSTPEEQWGRYGDALRQAVETFRQVLQEFRSHRSEQDPGRIRELLELADVQLESVSIQLQHLNHLKQQGNLKS